MNHVAYHDSINASSPASPNFTERPTGYRVEHIIFGWVGTASNPTEAEEIIEANIQDSEGEEIETHREEYSIIPVF